MPTYEMRAPNGRTYRISGPAGATDDQVRAKILQQYPEAGSPEPSWLDVGAQAIQNIPSSGAEFVKSMAQAITSPVQTAGALLDVASGAAVKALPKPVRKLYDYLDTDPQATNRAINAANQVGGMYKQRYGSIDALKRTIAKDPVGAAADLSTVLSGGAGIVRGGAKAAARVAPTVSAKAAKVANVMSRAGDVVNPVNVMAKPARIIPKVIERAPVAAKRFVSPKQTAYLQAAEGRAPEIVRQLRAPDIEIVPGSVPTAAQAASPLGVTQFSALGASAEKALPTPYYARAGEQEAARLNAMRSVGKTPADIATAMAARETAVKPLYAAADKTLAVADTNFEKLLSRPSMDKVLSRARQLAAEENVPFQIGQNRPAQTVPSKILDVQGQPMGVTNIPAEYAKYTGRSLHFMKMAFDDLVKNPERFGIGATEARAIGKTRGEFIKWAENQVPSYGAARTTYAAMSKPINQMEVGQYLEGKLTSPLEGGQQRANVFATAVRDAAGTIRRATTNEARFKALTDILDPDQVRVVNAIKSDLERAMVTKQQAKAGGGAAPKATDIASAAERGVRLPNLLNRVTAVANDIISRLRGKIDSKLAIQLATEMLDPEAAATALQKAYVGEKRAKTIGAAGGAAARKAGEAIAAKPTLAGERVSNAMLQNGAPLVGYGEVDGQTYPMYGYVE